MKRTSACKDRAFLVLTLLEILNAIRGGNDIFVKRTESPKVSSSPERAKKKTIRLFVLVFVEERKIAIHEMCQTKSFVGKMKKVNARNEEKKMPKRKASPDPHHAQTSNSNNN